MKNNMKELENCQCGECLNESWFLELFKNNKKYEE
mgnify:CR=1 FL=1